MVDFEGLRTAFGDGGSNENSMQLQDAGEAMYESLKSYKSSEAQQPHTAQT